MSSKDKRILLIVGLVCIVIGAACLLIVHFHRPAPIAADAAADATTLPASIATTTSVTSTPPVSLNAAPESSTSADILTNSSGMQFEVVTTQVAQNRGLGGRAVIPDNYAMLFVFPPNSQPGFWMKDMLTSIDMIWLSANGTIVSINPSVSPSTYPEAFYSPVPIEYVLETKAGFAAEHGWTVGTQVQLPAPYGAG